ncbi:MAG: putative undecaprenyl-phosphate N-acetylglucosaminyl 1-phosphate transferase [candidate division WS2 bacterium]|nr:putative undecaprenyl-phosphate N-acetylglucosaminyl 1-phosphate transferase [Candidatus Psychracetigena formicireducens]
MIGFLAQNNYTIGVFFIAFLCSALLTPFSLYLGKKFKLIDYPSARKHHIKPIPRSGGLLLFPVIAIFSLFLMGTGNRELMGILLGGTVIWLTGILDDRFTFRAKYKFLGQFIGALILVLSGVLIKGINTPWGYVDLDGLRHILTILWIVGISNAINFIDGLDGLAGGVVIISSVAFVILAEGRGLTEVSLLSLVIAGAVSGFLLFNFPRAKIILGDSGSLTLGYLLGALSVWGALKRTTISVLVVYAIVLAIPLFDILYAIIRRKINGVPISQPDKGHIHHRLLDLGLTPTQTVVILYCISIVLAVIAVYIGGRQFG